MQDQLHQLWRQFQRQPPVLQASLLITPFLAAAVVVLASVLVSGSRRAGEAPASPALIATQANQAVAGGASGSAASATSTPSQTSSASPAPLVPLIVATAAPTPEPTQTVEPTPASVASRVYRVVNTDGQGASLRREPGATGQRIKIVAEGREVEAMGATREVGGVTWRSVRGEDGDIGWISSEFLEGIRADPRATATPAPLTIQVMDLTEAPARGQEAMVTVRTRPGVRCEVRVFLYGPATVPREGLQPTVANDEGLCSWTWKVPDDAVPGTWRYFVAVRLGDRQVSREITFAIR